jgi:SAM-dependent methyltransferase
MSPDEVWQAATWPFVRAQLPPAPARIIELGCGRAGGHITRMLDAGYEATGVDPEAPDGDGFRRVRFEDYRPGAPADVVIASLSLHHVADPAAILGRVRGMLRPGGTLVVIEWARENFDEATARWCFGHLLRGSGEAGAWLGDLQAEWLQSGQSWEKFCRGWAEAHGLHTWAAIRRELDARFHMTHQASGPYFFPELADADMTAEQAAIDAGEIRPGCVRYTGRPVAVPSRREDR